MLHASTSCLHILQHGATLKSGPRIRLYTAVWVCNLRRERHLIQGSFVQGYVLHLPEDPQIAWCELVREMHPAEGSRWSALQTDQARVNPGLQRLATGCTPRATERGMDPIAPADDACRMRGRVGACQRPSGSDSQHSGTVSA
jgi:hypothetical protein